MIESPLSTESRARILLFIFGLLLFVLAARLFVMQTIEHEKYYIMSEENRIRLMPEIAFRGIVYDRNGTVIVENRPLYTISAIPNEIEDIGKISEQLSRVLATPAEQIAKRINENKFLRYKPVRIARGVSFEAVCKIEENADKYPGIIFQLEPARKYPSGGIISHAVGYTSEISEKELEGLEGQRLSRGSDVGREGIEKYWDGYLRGRDGIGYLEITAEGEIVGDLPQRDNIPAMPGRDMILSLDYDLQMYTVSLFADTLSGACVALDPRNGEVLVLVSMPSYDANLFSGVLKSDDWNKLRENPQKPLLNRVIKGEYPPGSVFKLLVAGAGLEEEIIGRYTKFAACRGGYRFGNRIFHCWYAAGHGALSIVDAIAQSCDIYFYQLGQKLGLDKFAEYSRKCGFGAETGIDIPAEQHGLVPDQDWYNRKYGKGKWPVSVILNLSIGQGEVLVTPLQLANFYAALGNGGRLYRPHFLRKVFDRRDTTETKIEILGHLPFSDSTLALLKEACVGALYDEHGTARGSKIEGIRFAGKTGTAQNPHGDEHAWFCAFAPAENPIIAIAVIVENAGHGSEAAAPLASKVVRRYLEMNNLLSEKDTTEILVRGAED